MSQRFFCSSPDNYSQVLSTLDDAWGFPAHGCDHVFLPLSHAPKKDGMAYLAIQSTDAEMPPADAILADMLESGTVTEVTQVEYRSAMNAELP